MKILETDSRVLDGSAILLEQWCREPTFHVGKSTKLRVES